MKKNILFVLGILFVLCLSNNSVYAKDNPELLKEYFSESQPYKAPSISSICYNNYDTVIYYLNDGYKAEYGNDGQIYALTEEGKIQLTDSKTDIDKAFDSKYTYNREETYYVFVIDNVSYVLDKKTVAFNINIDIDGYNRQQYVLAYCVENGRPVINGMFHGLFETDENGIFVFGKSKLRDEILDFIADYLDGCDYIVTVNDNARQIVWNQKRYREVVKMNDYQLLAAFGFRANYDMVKILNREIPIGLPIGGAVSDVYSSYNKILKGKFVKDKNGNTKYYCNELTEIKVLKDYTDKSSIAHIHVANMSDEDQFKYFNCLKSLKYDVIVNSKKNEYLKDYVVELDNNLYFINKKGNLITSKWVKESSLPSNAGSYHIYSDAYVGKNGQLVTNKWLKKSGKKVYVNENGLIVRHDWVKGPDKKMVWVDQNGIIDSSRTPDEYSVYQKMEKIWNGLERTSRVGICSVFRNYLVKELYGKNAAAKEYKYDWNKIKVGDRIDISPVGGEGHTGLVLYKDEDVLYLFDSNHGYDEMAHYGEAPIYKYEMDHGQWNGFEKASFRLYRYY